MRRSISKPTRSSASSAPIPTTSSFRSNCVAEEGEPRQINSASALWQRSKSELSAEDYAGLQVDRHRVRRAGDDAALPRRGPLLLRGAAVRALDKTVRPVRAAAQGQGKALCPPRLHHRRRRSVAGLSALHPRRDRQRGPAAQHFARDAAEQSATGADPQGRHHPRGQRAGERSATRSRRSSQRSGTRSAP